MSTPKQRALLALLQEAMTTAVVFFAGSSQPYTYKVRKDWNLKKGDSLVVNSPRSGLTVVTVGEVDKSSRIDETDGITYTWAVMPVSTVAYEAELAKEKAFLEQLAEIDHLHKRLAMLTKVREALGANEETTKAFDEALKALRT